MTIIILAAIALAVLSAAPLRLHGLVSDDQSGSPAPSDDSPAPVTQLADHGLRADAEPGESEEIDVTGEEAVVDPAAPAADEPDKRGVPAEDEPIKPASKIAVEQDGPVDFDDLLTIPDDAPALTQPATRRDDSAQPQFVAVRDETGVVHYVSPETAAYIERMSRGRTAPPKPTGDQTQEDVDADFLRQFKELQSTVGRSLADNADTKRMLVEARNNAIRINSRSQAEQIIDGLHKAQKLTTKSPSVASRITNALIANVEAWIDAHPGVVVPPDELSAAIRSGHSKLLRQEATALSAFLKETAVKVVASKKAALGRKGGAAPTTSKTEKQPMNWEDYRDRGLRKLKSMGVAEE